MNEGRLSGLWAQEVIGADLAKEELRRWLSLHTARRPVPVAVVDDGLSATSFTSLLCDNASVAPAVASRSTDTKAHGYSVARLVADPVFGSAGHACFSFLGQVEKGKADRGQAGPAVVGGYDPLFANPARILNVSSRLNFAPSAAQLNQLADQGRIVVQAAGNEFPDFDPLERLMPKVIHVGSIAPDGLVSAFSAQFPELAVLAPSNHELLSAPDVIFSGTSGAAPLVAGALANVLDVLPEIGPTEAKLLLAKTSVPTFVQVQGRSLENGAGLLNAYKLVRAAECLATQTSQSPATKLEGSTRCFDFRIEARAHLAKADAFVRSADCGDRREAWRELRMSFLLDPLPSTARRLSAFERSLGKTSNALFYRSFLTQPADVQSFLAETMREEPQVVTFGYGPTGLLPVQIAGPSTYALLSRVAPNSLPASMIRQNLTAQAHSPDDEVRRRAVDLIAAGGPGGRDLLLGMQNDSSENVRDRVEDVLRQMSLVRAWASSNVFRAPSQPRDGSK